MFRRIEHLIRPFLCSERLRLRCVEHRAAALHLPAGLEVWITEVHTRQPGEVRVLLHRFGATDMVVGLACLGNGDAFIIMSSSHVNLYRFMVGMLCCYLLLFRHPCIKLCGDAREAPFQRLEANAGFQGVD